MLKTIYAHHDRNPCIRDMSRDEYVEKYKHIPELITGLEKLESTLNECYTKYYGGPLCNSCMLHRECVDNQGV